MKNLLRSVLIIDGNYDTGSSLKSFLRENNLSEEIALFTNAWSAINFLKKQNVQGIPLPNISFIDLDLPQLSAWNFLDKVESQIGRSRYHEIYLLSNSDKTDDMIKASLNPLATGIINKPVMDREVNRIAYNYAKRIRQNVA